MPRPEGIDEWMEECKAKGHHAAMKIKKVIDEFESDTGCFVKDLELSKSETSTSEGTKSCINTVGFGLNFYP